jgi:predicted transposase/invertase (TIGR01784 family)
MLQMKAEMQIGDRADMERRSTFYICRMFGDQKIIKGKYKDLKRAIAINILDFVRSKDSQRYHTRFRLLELEESIELTDALEIHFIELPKLKMLGSEKPSKTIFGGLLFLPRELVLPEYCRTPLGVRGFLECHDVLWYAKQ